MIVRTGTGTGRLARTDGRARRGVGFSGFGFIGGRLFGFLIIGRVKTTSLKNQSRTRAYQTFHRSRTVDALLQRFIRHFLVLIKMFFAFQALVFVSRHNLLP